MTAIAETSDPSARPATKRPAELRIDEASSADETAWEAYITQRTDSTFVDSWRWREVLERSYGLPCFWFIAKRGDEICGVLALTLTRHPLLGDYLATAPFANFGGFYFESEDVAAALLDTAEALRQRLRARYVNIRHLQSGMSPPAGWLQHPAYATYWLELPTDADTFLSEHLRTKTRAKVKQALNSGFSIQFGGLPLLEPFWHVMSHAMKELGSPYHSKAYLENIIHAFGARALLAVIYSKDGEPAGASLLLLHNDFAVQLHANVLEKFYPLRPAEFLYFSVIAECCSRRVKTLDMGRSLVESGNEEFKMKWRPTRHELAYWYRMKDETTPLPVLNQANPKFRLAIRTWQQLPLWVSRLAGPRLITGIL